MQRLHARPATRKSHAAQGRAPGDRRHALIPQLVVAGVLGLATVLLSLVYWPGSLDPDVLSEMQEAQTGHFTDWHTPLLEALWRIPLKLGLNGPGWILPVSLFTLLVGFYLILRIRFARPWATLIAILCAIFPPVLTWATHDGTDAWFAAAMLASFGFAARVARTAGRSRTISVAAAVWFACIAYAARRNSAPAILILFIVLAALLLPAAIRRRKLTAVGLGALATVAVILLGFGLQAAIGTRSSHPQQGTYVYDVAQLSLREHRDLFPPSIDPGQNLSAIYAGTTVYSIDGLVFPKNHPVRFFLQGKQYSELQNAWESALRHHPFGYLVERVRLGVWMLSIGHPSFWLYNPVTGTGWPNPPQPKFPSVNHAGYTYLQFLTVGSDLQHGDFLYDGWVYVIILVLGAVVLWRRTAADRVVAALAIAILLYTLVLAFTSPGELYRYIYPMVATGVVVTALLLPILVTSMRQGLRSEGRTADADPPTDLSPPPRDHQLA